MQMEAHADVELLSCPFCAGGARVILYSTGGENYVNYHKVECNKCGASGPECYAFDNETAYKKAVKRWNSRAGDAKHIPEQG